MIPDSYRNWVRGIKERIALVNDWNDRGLCMACGEEMATRQLPPAMSSQQPLNLCVSCEKEHGVEKDTIPIPDPHLTPPLRVPIL